MGWRERRATGKNKVAKGDREVAPIIYQRASSPSPQTLRSLAEARRVAPLEHQVDISTGRAAHSAIQDAAFRVQAGQKSEVGENGGPRIRRRLFKVAAEVAVVASSGL